MIENFDAIIIGSGQAGNPLLTDLAEAGWKVAMIEREHTGGTCINTGCTPTKTLIASSEILHEVRRARELGVNVRDISSDFPKIIARKDKIVHEGSESRRKKIESTKNATLIWGEAAFRDAYTIEVKSRSNPETRQLRGRYIFINTGGRPAPPVFPGADTIDILDSTSVMELNAVPKHLAIIGGSYTALEFGQFFRRLGSQVTILERSKTFLEQEDRDVAEAIRDHLKSEGIDIRLGVSVKSVQKAGEEIRLTTAGEPVTASHVLYAAGRVPNTEALHLEQAGIQIDENGYIIVNDKLETNVPNIYALGDVNGGPAFTHISYDDYRIVRDNLLHHKCRSTKGRMAPYTMFIDPQFSRIGLSETEAKEKNIEHRVLKIPMSLSREHRKLGTQPDFSKLLFLRMERY